MRLALRSVRFIGRKTPRKPLTQQAALRHFHDQQYFYNKQDIKLEDFKQYCEQQTEASDYPLASNIQNNVVVYDGDAVRATLDNQEHLGIADFALRIEMTKCLRDGPGVFIVKNAYRDTAIIDEVSVAYAHLIAREKELGLGGDHFGTNERLWNSLQKLCLYDPAIFVEYFGSPILALGSRAWLGPFYQLSAQVNNVKPGGAAQTSHRDYHLGFQTLESCELFPAHAQIASQFLTLQGAISHQEIPLANGPTRFLPFTHKYPPGYLSYTLPEFGEYFKENYVTLPLEKGDMIFFNPALYHAGGENTSTYEDRLLNLFQVSSGMGRCMETVDRASMLRAAYPFILSGVQSGKYELQSQVLHDVLVASGESYAFPNNLDKNDPVDGLAPETQVQLAKRALAEEWSADKFNQELDSHCSRILS